MQLHGRTAAVIVAAGKSTRMNMNANKQYVDLAGKPVLAWTIGAFEDCGMVDEIIIVVNENDVFYCKDVIVDAYGFSKVRSIVAGGDTRQKSVLKGISEACERCGIIAVHDGARPFISCSCIEESIKAAIEFGASCVSVPAKDTIKKADDEGFVIETLQRTKLWNIQTPQVFETQLLLQAHKKAIEDDFEGTDDAMLVERLGSPIKLVLGSYFNIKLTTKEDLLFAKAIAEVALRFR